jgi:hypothetical protein
MKTPLPMFIAVSLLGASVVVPAAEPAAAAPAETGKPDAAQQPAKPAASTAATERVELGTTQITGNRELPRVLYVVPWKRPDLGESSGKPVKSLLDEVLAPVDRDVFRRQNRYHDALQPDAAATSVSAGADDRGVEK